MRVSDTAHVLNHCQTRWGSVAESNFDEGDGGASASVGVVAMLRKRIVDGHYPPQTRLAETAVAQDLGVSRTPVRMAFRTLAQEGLLQQAGKRGLVVRSFTEVDVLCAVEVRGVLEGLAARRVAEAGLDDATRSVLSASVSDGRQMLAAGPLTLEGISRWSRLNRAFHQAIVAAGGSTVIGDAIARNNHLPFASADSITLDAQALDREDRKLRFAQMQHELVLDALLRREPARVEMLMREHAYVGVRYASLRDT